ncbi:MAG TPA: nucleoid-associated protein, partial [Candidatus Nitrosocosmicus sp.]|nr:nucleoid-associated protein [Candidatus Nitrosocosmicus sp.]
MRNIEEILINKAVVHVLDKENCNITFSEREIELTETAYEYLEKHILKLFKNDDAKAAVISKESIVGKICAEILTDETKFLDDAGKLAQYFYRWMCNDEHETSGDFVVCQFESQTGIYLALLKLDFTEAYSHYLRDTDGKAAIDVTINKNVLPGTGQKLSKAVIIKEPDERGNFQALVIDKDWDSTFIQAFLRCEFTRDRLENTKLFHAVAERFARRAFKDNAREAEIFRTRMAEHLQNEDSVSIDKLAEVNIGDAMLKAEFKAVMANEGFKESEVPIDREWAAKKLHRKRLKIDKSIELYIDTEAYKDKDKFEIKRNGDGTIDIIL